MLVIVGSIFIILNAGSVKIDFYLMKLTVPISLVMLVMFGFGLLVGVLLFVVRYLRLQFELMKIRNQLQMSEIEIKNLRTIPLKN